MKTLHLKSHDEFNDTCGLSRNCQVIKSFIKIVFHALCDTNEVNKAKRAHDAADFSPLVMCAHALCRDNMCTVRVTPMERSLRM
jgi:hypothetical protein